jgi:hypothetical protein
MKAKSSIMLLLSIFNDFINISNDKLYCNSQNQHVVKMFIILILMLCRLIVLHF